MSLARLIYASKASGTFRIQDLDAILASARRKNAAKGITGLLLYGRGTFFQVLEGDAIAISDLFERLRSDPRHTDIVRLRFAPIKARVFREWKMGLINLDTWGSIDRKPIDAILSVADTLKEHGDEKVLVPLLREFMRQLGARTAA